uniref:Alpha-ketoglutarate-dependent dioxygenase AlkB-like domain-containing protein n=1 Tax=Eutreptiella gymnastica TaxID=73025 RepID=A0A7S1JH52_9EUGL|mmetsp:Transcript_95203/g.164281  ORF Transcript_95203/g.164281 Transcript_95203/m.164281 type:complete len:302 (+) Transcript_95203:27-932(+)
MPKGKGAKRRAYLKWKSNQKKRPRSSLSPTSTTPPSTPSTPSVASTPSTPSTPSISPTFTTLTIDDPCAVPQQCNSTPLQIFPYPHPVIPGAGFPIDNLPALLYEEAVNLGLVPQGFSLIHDFITPQEEAALLAFFDNQGWDASRTQQYGWTYNHHSGVVTQCSPPHHTLPRILQPYVKDIVEATGSETPVQLIAREQLPGGGIVPHVDRMPAFGDHITGISLGGWVTYAMYPIQGIDGHIVRIFIPPRSLVVMTGPARGQWAHAIPKVREDFDWCGQPWPRTRRVSLTFRSIQVQHATRA